MDVLVAILAFAGALLAGITTGVLIGRLRDEAAGWLIAWSIATGALALSLAAVAVGHLAGFGGVTFRAFQITGSLLAPLWLTVGVLQLLAEKATARFTSWLLGIALTIVGAVIMLLDPIVGGFTKDLPAGPPHWDIWPEWLLRGVHILVIFLLLVALAIALLSWRDGDDFDVDNMNATVVLAPAGMALSASLELTLPGVVVVALMGVAAGGVWYAVARPLAPYDDEDDEDGDEDDDWRGRQSQGRGRRGADGGDGGATAASPMPAGSSAASPRRSGLGDLVAEYRAGEQGEVDYAARMQPGDRSFAARANPADGYQARIPQADDFGGPATGQLLPADPFGQGRPAEYGMPAARPDQERGMPATGAVFPGAEAPPPADLAASFGVGFSRSAAKPRPAGGSVKPSPSIYGLLTVFTLLDGSGDAFDKLAEETVEAVQRTEPDTLIFVCHGVKSAPLQRIVYELYRDEVGFAEHQRQPHMERFATERVPFVLAANVIELTVNAAKVVPLPTALL
ncbi:hypothetical protein GCM10009530_09930 [Microbispora corallina]|uniref:ABM domain-containing protein n=1 Tax=Microbispora corallina TaxID=83302 RepID=A0ABQ4FVW9_9ACTN|nr:hypothetical protein [Microbispora corallina]GIH38956.1 hypothetical protein Mco01_19560 [Microbispora corallina]